MLRLHPDFFFQEEALSQRIPEKLIALCDQAVDGAYGRDEVPKNIQDLAEWLFWESNDPGRDEINGFCRLSSFEFTDTAMREQLGRRLISAQPDENRDEL